MGFALVGLESRGLMSAMWPLLCDLAPIPIPAPTLIPTAASRKARPLVVVASTEEVGEVALAAEGE